MNGPMGKRTIGSARTAPKGRATPGRSSGGGRRRLLTPTVQWILVVLLGVAIVGTVLYLLRDTGTNVGAADESGAARPVVPTLDT